MAKKKQLAGKKTKLARLPLTQALTNQAQGGALWSPPPSPVLSPGTQLPRTWDEVAAGRGGPVVAAFFSLVRELADLKAALQAPQESAGINFQAFLPYRPPQQPQVMQALRQARQSLLDLKSLLAAA